MRVAQYPPDDSRLIDMSWKNIDLASEGNYAKSIFQLICNQVEARECRRRRSFVRSVERASEGMSR